MNLDAYKKAFESLPEGVKAAEVYTSSGSSFSVNIQDGRIEKYSVSDTAGLGLRADCGKMGYAYTEQPGDDPLRLLHQARENAAAVECEDEQFLFAGAASEEYAPSRPADPRLANASAEEKIRLAKELERLTLAQDERILKVQSCVLSTQQGSSSLFNSLGLDLRQEDGLALAYVIPIAACGDGFKNGMGYQLARCPEELDLPKIAREAAEDLFAQFGARPVPTGTYDIILQNTAAADLLEAFESIFSADAAQKGLSLLSGREGQQIASPAVTILDDPRCPESLYYSVFDGEGVPAHPHTILEAGRLNTLLHNLKTAKKAGCASTGNAARSLSGPVGVAAHNLLIQSGEKDLPALQKALGRGLMIADVSGLHAGVNPVSGDFSLLSRGFLIENGQAVRPVDQITIAGNFLQLLSSLEEAGSDLRFGLSNVGCPSLLIRGVEVSGE